jgi:hypothetical protein
MKLLYVFKEGAPTSIRCSFLHMNLGGRILVSTLLAVIVTAAAGAQSAPAVSSAEARKAIQAGYVEWEKARVAMDKNTIERMLAPDLYVQTPEPKTNTAGVYRCNLLPPVYLDTI